MRIFGMNTENSTIGCHGTNQVYFWPLDGVVSKVAKPAQEAILSQVWRAVNQLVNHPKD